MSSIAASACAVVSATTTPFPAARPSALITTGRPYAASAAFAAAASVNVRARPVGTPAASMTSFAKRLDPSMRAPAATGPNAFTPIFSSASTSPLQSGASGPTTTRSGRFASAHAATAATSSAPMARFVASAAVPALPGAQ